MPANPSNSRPKPAPRPFRWLSLVLIDGGVTREVVSFCSIVLGIVAGLAFLLTSIYEGSMQLTCWLVAIFACLSRSVTNKVEEIMFHMFARRRDYLQEEPFTVLPERVSDAVTLIGFGFAYSSNHWLGLAAALFAILSAYIRFTAGTSTLSSGSGNVTVPLGPMPRVRRLILMTVSSLLVVFGLTRENTGISIPAITLWAIVLGCIATIAIRWFHVQKLRKR